MTASLLGDPDLACVLDLGQLGLAIVDRRLIVVERTGSLSGWLPEAGRGCCDCPLLFGMEAEFAALRENPGAPLNLPSVQAASDGERINISLAWNGETGHFVIVTTPDEGTKQLERLLFRERREMQLLQQQAAAAMDRSRIDATLYRDIVEVDQRRCAEAAARSDDRLRQHARREAFGRRRRDASRSADP